VDGMSWERYLALPSRRRLVMHLELVEMMPEPEEDGDGERDGGAPVRPKRMRK
jgi:hypothetical protein